MNVSEMMTRGVRTCSPADSLNSVARLMWENDLGCIPVVDGGGLPTERRPGRRGRVDAKPSGGM